MSFITSPGIIVPPLTAGGAAYGTGTQAKVTSAGTSGQFLQSAGAGVPVWAAAGGFSQAQVFTSSGTFTVPASGKFKVTIVGGGGAGSFNNSASASGGSGGGAGSVIKWFTGATAAATATITIGAGGVGNSTNADGNTGGNSTFVLTGFGTLTASGGGGGLYGPDSSNGGTGGTATGGDVNVNGQHGGRPVINSALSEAVNTMAGSSLLGLGGASFQQGAAGAQSATGYGGGGIGINNTGPAGSGSNGICIVES